MCESPRFVPQLQIILNVGEEKSISYDVEIDVNDIGGI